MYGPFLVAPFGALISGYPLPGGAWFARLAVLPGRLPAAFLADALGASPAATLTPIAASLTIGWILLTAWCSSECRTIPVLSAGLSSVLAAAALLAFLL